MATNNLANEEAPQVMQLRAFAEITNMATSPYFPVKVA